MDDGISENENSLYLLMKIEGYVEWMGRKIINGGASLYKMAEKNEREMIIDPACTYGIDWPS